MFVWTEEEYYKGPSTKTKVIKNRLIFLAGPIVVLHIVCRLNYSTPLYSSSSCSTCKSSTSIASHHHHRSRPWTEGTNEPKPTSLCNSLTMNQYDCALEWFVKLYRTHTHTRGALETPTCRIYHDDDDGSCLMPPLIIYSQSCCHATVSEWRRGEGAPKLILSSVSIVVVVVFVAIPTTPHHHPMHE